MSAMIGNSLLLGGEGYQISRSVRLRSSASAYFNRTLSTPTSNTTWTFSCWLKRGALSNSGLFAESTGFAGIYFASDKIRVMNNAGGLAIETAAVFRDPSAWAHFVVRSNGTNIKAYWNSVEVGSYTGTITLLNAATSHFIGRYSTNYFDGYLTEINFIDGQALDPSSFGETDAVTGVWKPKKYAGTYGTNGFYLNFSDNSAATAAAIGKDYSGNGNNWTPNNISVTAGVTYDSMLDVPTQWADGGNGRGNYAVLNPIGVPFANGTITDGNLKFAGLTTTDKGVAATISISSGAFYWESTQLTNSGSSNCYAGVILTGASSDVNANRVYVRGDGLVLKYGTSLGTVFSTFTNNDVIGFAFDRANNTLAIYKNGTLGYTVTGLNNADHTPWVGGYTTTDTWAVNFGQRPFSYTPPTGFKALNTLNLPAPTILKGNQYMDATTYTGTGASLNVVNSGGMQPDFVWTKPRSTAVGHTLFDSLRGVTKYLQSNTTGAEGTAATSLTAFNSNGFTVNSDTSTGANGVTYVGWQWKEGATQGFDIVTYTGTGVARTVAHSLGVAPAMMIVKNRGGGGVDGWVTYHSSIGNTGALILNTTAATQTTSLFWNNTSPTSSVFSVSTSSGVNANTNTYVAYLFSEVAGFSKAFSYTGNGSADGTFVFLGFRPRWIMFKKTSGTSNWSILDTARDDFNVSDNPLLPNTSGAETTSTSTSGAIADILSNGFKLRGNSGDINDSGATYIGFAFAEHPFKNALAR